jgi:PAS domain-containing protein
MALVDKDFWCKLETYSNPSPVNDCNISGPGADKRARHNVVERNRREKTRSFIEKLQTMLPNIAEKKQNPNINFILEKALEYLQDENQTPLHLLGADDHFEDSDEEHGFCKDKVKTYMASRIPNLMADDVSFRRHMFTFDNAPFGIVIARTDGVLLKANDYFRSMFIVPQGPLIGYTMFKLTSSRDLPTTMRVFDPH